MDSPAAGVKIPEALRILNADSRLGSSTPSGNFPLAFSLNGLISANSSSSSSSSSPPTENAVAGVLGEVGLVISVDGFGSGCGLSFSSVTFLLSSSDAIAAFRSKF